MLSLWVPHLNWEVADTLSEPRIQDISSHHLGTMPLEYTQGQVLLIYELFKYQNTNSTCTDFYVNWVHIFCSPKIMQKIFAFKNGLAISYFLLTLLYLRQCGLLALSVIIYECVSYDLVNRLAHHNIRPLFSFNCINPLQ